MQISRHWRLNSQRYRLQGVRYEDGKVSLQDRPERPNTEEVHISDKQRQTPSAKKVIVAVA